MSEDYIGIVSIVGEEGSCKSSMSLSFEKPLYNIELDIGGFARAEWRYKCEKKVLGEDEHISSVDLSKYQIISKPYSKPLDVSKMMGQISEGRKTDSKFTVRFPKQVVGVKELWQRIITDFVEVVQIPGIKSICIDTATILYNYCHQAVLQEAQERQIINWKNNPATKNIPFDENNFRERLQPVEYAPAYDRLRTLYQTASSFHKNLVLVHYPTDEYIKAPDKDGNMVDSKSGVKVADGWKETAKLADLILWTTVKETTVGGVKRKSPTAKITKAGIRGMGLDAVGMEVDATFEAVINLRNVMRGTQ
jgi:hypothetical protein